MRMRRSPYTITPFFPTSSHQYGRGGITVFRGSAIPHMQYERGLGSLFKSVAHVVTPLAAQAVRYVGRRGLETGIRILSDVLGGENVKAAAKRRASTAFQQAKQDVLAEVKRRRGPSTTTTTTGKKKRRKGGQKGGRVMTMVRRRPRCRRRRPTTDFLDKTTSLRTGISFPHKLRSCEHHYCFRRVTMELEQVPKHYASSHGGNFQALGGNLITPSPESNVAVPLSSTLKRPPTTTTCPSVT